MKRPAVIQPNAPTSLLRCVLEVRVIPGASRDEIVGWEADGSLKIKVRAPPFDGRANEAVLCFLADYWKIHRRHIGILSGATSRRKRLEITGLSLDEIRRRTI